ncbi:MAG: hypothetical protein QOJ97_882 [Solirubrobacteraceae bacterium]|jgi:glycosyltransferase involved in cell wall biosynthesis|nr:hypothetical protein [Solirubrobacteraceae bacterium]
MAGLSSPLPTRVAVGPATILALRGWVTDAACSITRLSVTLEGNYYPASSFRPRRAARPIRAPAVASSFWAFLPLPSVAEPRVSEIALDIQLDGQISQTIGLGRVALTPGLDPRPETLARVEAARPADGEPHVSICMATCDPDPELLRTQIASLRAQTHQSWTCIVSDDASRPEHVAAIDALCRDDPRFIVVRHHERIGPYRNFERALALVPRWSNYVALCDQDDVWNPDKLTVLLSQMRRGTQLAYGDMRVVDVRGRVLASTYWVTRKNNFRSLASLLVTNTVTGAAALFRREVLDIALPFPSPVGELFHDHWIACAAMAGGKLAYVPRTLQDYVQHEDNVIGHCSGGASSRAVFVRRLLATARRRSPYPWQDAFFDDVLRVGLIARVLEARCISPPLRRRAALALVGHADDSMLGTIWLAARGLHRAGRRSDTADGELHLLEGLIGRRAYSVI